LFLRLNGHTSCNLELNPGLAKFDPLLQMVGHFFLKVNTNLNETKGHFLMLTSRVSLGCPAPGEKNIFAPPPTKPVECEVNNRCKSAEEAKSEHLLFVTFVIFRNNKIRLTLETHSTNLYQAEGPWAPLPRCGNFTAFLKKKIAFWHVLV